MENRNEELNTAKKLITMKNFKLKQLCKTAEAKYNTMPEYDPRDNSSMCEALWSLGSQKLSELL
jgi:hypothetical protein